MKLKKLISPWMNELVSDSDSDSNSDLNLNFNADSDLDSGSDSGYELDLEILGLQNDSRKVKSGFLFCAYPGGQVDGRAYISDAIKAGAIAVLYEPEKNEKSTNNLRFENNLKREESLKNDPAIDVPCIPFSGLATKLAQLANRFYENPSRQMSVIGVTGTNGKTTIAYQLAQSFSLLGTPSAYIGTLGEGQVNQLRPLNNTTPDALCLQQLLFAYQNQAVQSVCMEVSSHALCQHRVDEIHFEQAIFTNLSHEHLDYHLSMDAYAQAKANLFAYPSLRQAIINADDPYSMLMKEAVKSPACEIICYGINKQADVNALNLVTDISGSFFEVNSPWGRVQVKINALGFFNIYNSLAILSSLVSKGYSLETSASVMAQLSEAPGRMEVVNQEPCIIVDYAHTPDALQSALTTLQKIKQKRLVVIVGCGGNRDKTKRPLMGKIAISNADIAIFTNDNPRNEDPLNILKEIELGVPAGTKKTRYYQIADRKEAIQQGINLLEKGDILLIAGKGHESYQEIGNTRYPFSDQRVVRGYLKITD